ncbi:MAG: DegT/DnrJ/EryC1/StrS family aminotransferase [Treponema sp.]|jgi:dTDP-4-amino-4,6-dideoxygalactose transaminase|nr:DegT/DnrJ/EryC1/StrS family aminotransferase [Treponema sp.]
MKIEVFSPTIRRKEMDAVLTALVEDKIGPGEQGRLLIQHAKEHLKFDYCLALRSPAIALHIALKALDFKDGQGVVLSALSPRYYREVLRELRLAPLYADVENGSPLMGKAAIEAAVGREKAVEARCILLHHSLGFLPRSQEIASLGLPVIEDRSESFGSGAGIPPGGEDPKGNPAKDSGSLKESSSFRDSGLAVYSIMGLEERDMLTGGGGALLYAASRRDGSALRNFAGLPPEYCLPDMNAAMAVIQLRESERNLERRREIAQVYGQAAQRTRHRRFAIDDELSYNNYAFPLILETGVKDVKAYARKKDILVEGAFARTLMGAIAENGAEGGWEAEQAGGLNRENCPEAYSLSLRTVLFPLYPRLSSAEVDRISKLIQTLP